MSLPKCDECGFGYDPKDPRSHNSERMHMCPLCLAMMSAHTEWAVKNDCNGIFETRPRRKAAEELLANEYSDVDARVVPAKVVEIECDFDVFSANKREDEIEGR